jgi:uncharacterized protein (DUF885 family)
LWAYLDRLVVALHERSPEWVGPTIGDETRNHLLTDTSPEAIAAWAARVGELRAELAGIDASGFSEADRLDAEIVAFQLDEWLAAAAFERWQMPITSMGGPQVELPQLADQVPMTRDRHVSDYLNRLSLVRTQLVDAMTAMRLGVAAGRVPPKVVVQPAVAQALAQCTGAVADDPTASAFFRPFARLAETDERRARAAAIIETEIVPAFADLARFLTNEYLPACRESVGASEGVDGRAYYDNALREHTTLALTAEEVHELGLKEVSRIRAEMLEVIDRTDWEGVGRTWPDEDAKLSAFFEYLRTDERFYFTRGEDLLNAYRVISKRADAEMPRLFGLLPRLPYGVREIPEFAAKSSPTAFYYRGSLSGGVPGFFMANLTSLNNRPRYDMVPLTLHEAVPGHHHQISIQQELEGQHVVRRLMGFTAYIEGWGLYAERLGLEMEPNETGRGMYADPYDDFGRLNYEMWRACRLVIDTGLHSFGWTRQRAIDFMLANRAATPVDTVSEIDRYIGWPGQATAYKVGELKIRELRARAEAELGAAFDVRAFHDALLDGGSVPLPVLEAKIERWIESQRGG